jgi:hypothetical protein
MTTRIFNKEIKFSNRSLVVLVGGHPAGGILRTEGIVLDTRNDIEPRYYCHIIAGNPRAVYPYTESIERVFSQSELAEAVVIDFLEKPAIIYWIKSFFSKYFK